MKTILALSALALTSASVFALNSANTVRREISRPFYMQQTKTAIEKNAQPIQLKGMKTMTAMPQAVAGPNKAPQTTFGAFYGFGEGTYHCSLLWDGGWYGYQYALAMGFPYSSKFDAILGDSWSMVTASSTIDLNDQKDSEGNLVLSDLGIGSYYMPTIQNGKTSYLYGASKTGQILINASEVESMPYAMFDANELTGFYGGVNTGSASGYAYGSSTPYGGSGITEIDFGKVAGPLQVESLNMWLTTNAGEERFATDEDYILVTIFDKVGEETFEYSGKVTAENIEAADNGSECAIVTFTDVDEDGFETEIYPVLRGEVTVVIENTPGCNYGIIMADSDVEDVDAKGRSIYPSSTAWYHDGSQMDEGMYHWQGADAVVMINALYNAMLTYGENSNETTGYVFSDAQYSTSDSGEEYTWAVSIIDEEDGKKYNDFNIESTFNSEMWSVEYDEDVVLGFDINEDNFEDYSIVSVFVAVKALPEGVDSRNTDVVFTSNDGATYTIHVIQGEETGLASVNEEVANKVSYNLFGQKVADTKAAGLYIIDGKKVIK